MKILLTGSSGFIGSHIKRIARGEDIIPYDLENGNDVLDIFSLTRKAQRAEGVIHLAGPIAPVLSDDNPYRFYRYNVEGTAVVARICSTLNLPLIYASSGDVVMCNSHYASSKLGAEHVIEVERKTRGLKALTVRFLNPYGRGLHTHTVIPIFFRRCLRGKPLYLHGGGTQTKDFTYAGDIARTVLAYLKMAEGFEKKIVTIGTGKQTSIKELAEIIKLVTESESEIIVKGERRAGEHKELKTVNFEKIEGAVSLKEGILSMFKGGD